MKKYELLKDLPDHKIGDINTNVYWSNWFNIHNFPTNTINNNTWFKEIKPIFYTEDFKDGSFPEKSCSNCKNNTKRCSVLEPWNNRDCPLWRNILRGEAIYKDDKCREVYKSKYFSNEANARKYHESLQPSAEEKANELGFKVGDGVWETKYETYKGCIQEFLIHDSGLLSFKSEKGTYALHNVTNKVAIHTFTQKEYKFICNKVNRSPKIGLSNYKFYISSNGSKCISSNKAKADNYLVLSVDEYMQSQGIRPLFVSEDGVNMYERMDWVFIDECNGINVRENLISKPHDVGYKIFSTKQAAKDYLENLKPKLMLGDVEITISTINDRIYAKDKGVVSCNEWLDWYDKIDTFLKIATTGEIGLKLVDFPTLFVASKCWDSGNNNIGCIDNVTINQIKTITDAIRK